MVALSDPPRMTMACPGCAALPEGLAVPVVQAEDIPLSLPGIHCMACIRTVENALGAREDVDEVRVNLTLRRAYVRPHSPDLQVSSLVGTLAEAGIEAHELDPGALGQTASDRDGRALLTRLAVAGFAAMNVMLLSVAVWSGASDATRDLFHWISAAITLPAIAYVGQPFWAGALRAIRAGRLNMDVPIALAILLALVTSLWETALAGHHAYFDAALALCFFLLIGRYLDFRARAAARSAAEELTALEVPRALRVNDGMEETVPVAEICVGDLVLVRPGGRMPVDGVVSEGLSDVDTSFLTGETQPLQAGPGAAVSAGQVNLSGPLTIRATAIGADTSLHRLTDLVAVAEAGRSRYTPLADKAAALYAPGVHVLAGLAFAGWYLATLDPRTALNIAAAVLIITCPCALGLAVPAVTTAASGRLFRRGFLVKAATALERLAQVDTVIFDKTGTLTRGRMQLTNAQSLSAEAQAVACALAAGSDHPMARAIAKALDVRPACLEDRLEVSGLGTEALWNGQIVRLGRAGWAGPEGDQSTELSCWFRIGDAVPVRLCFADVLRDGAVGAVQALQDQGIEVHLLSGDRAEPVANVAAELGIAHVEAACTPEDKMARIRALKQEGRTVLMVGDGLNDTGALTTADVSISPAEALDAARTASDIVLLGETLAHLPEALSVAQVARRRITQNFRIATWYNVIAVPLAVAGLATPLIAALAMSSSSVTVSLNALRLRVS